jgi:hypothetical protein
MTAHRSVIALPPTGPGACRSRRTGGSCVDVELPRDEHAALRAQLDLRAGSRLYLKPLRVTRFAEAG